MSAEARLKRLFTLEDSLTRQLQGVRAAIALAGADYSREQGYLVPLRAIQLKREVN